MTKQQGSLKKEKKKEEVPLISDNHERLSVYSTVQLLLQKIKKIQLEKQVARDICLGMTSSFELLK